MLGRAALSEARTVERPGVQNSLDLSRRQQIASGQKCASHSTENRCACFGVVESQKSPKAMRRAEVQTSSRSDEMRFLRISDKGPERSSGNSGDDTQVKSYCSERFISSISSPYDLRGLANPPIRIDVHELPCVYRPRVVFTHCNESVTSAELSTANLQKNMRRPSPICKLTCSQCTNDIGRHPAEDVPWQGF